MTLRTNARIAGIAFLLYIVFGLTSMTLSNRAYGGAEETAAKLASIAQHVTTMRVEVILTLLMAGCALALAVTLHALTCSEDRDLALFGFACRAGEGLVIAALSTRITMELLAAANAGATAVGAEAVPVIAYTDLLLKKAAATGNVAAVCFAAGSTFFSYLFLRARTIPIFLARLGVVASLLLVAVLPMHLAGFLGGMLINLAWLPMLVFEVWLALWLIFKGVSVAPPVTP